VILRKYPLVSAYGLSLYRQILALYGHLVKNSCTIWSWHAN